MKRISIGRPIWSTGMALGLLLALLVMIGCEQPDVYQYESQLRERITKRESDRRLPQEKTPGTIPSGLPDGPMTLAEVIQTAMVYSPALKAARKDVFIARDDIKVADSAFWPELSASGSLYQLKSDLRIGDATLLEDRFWQAELALNWMLWDFGRSQGRHQLARLAHEISQVSFRRQEQSIIYKATQSYYNILRVQKAQTIAAEGLKAAKAQLNTAENLFAQGQVTHDDVLRAEVQVARYEQRVIEADNAGKLASSVLNREMGINVNHATQIVEVSAGPTFEHTLDWALDQAVHNRPEFEQVQLAIVLAKSEHTIDKAEYLPKVFVSGSVMHVEDTGNLGEDSARASLGIQIDLFAGGRKSARVRQSENKISQALDKAQEVCDIIALEVKQSYLGIEDARGRLPVAAKALSSARENARLVQEKYRNSLATSTSVVDAEAVHTEAQQDYYRALYDLMSAIERLHFAMGTIDSAHAVAAECHN